MFAPISQSSRWNRQPIITGSSDCDDRGDGGGVSLTAVSDFDDGTPMSAGFGTPDHSFKKPALLNSNLRGDAAPFQFTKQFNTPYHTSTDSRNDTPPLSLPVAISGDKDATSAFMSIYREHQQRKRSATTATQAGYANGDNVSTHGQNGRGTNTANSSPIKGFHMSRLEQTNGTVFESANPDLERTQCTPTRMRPSRNTISSMASNDIVKVTPSRLTDANMASMDIAKVTPTNQSDAKQYQSKWSPSNNAGQVYNDHIISPSHNAGSERRLNVQNYSAYMQNHMLGHQNDDTTPSYEQQRSRASTINHQPNEWQGRVTQTPSRIPFCQNGGQNEQIQQVTPSRIYGYPPPRYQPMADAIDVKSTPTKMARSYHHQLSGSVSDRNMTQYLPDEHHAASMMALVPAQAQDHVGPMDFGMPTIETMAHRSDMLRTLTEAGQPNLQDLLDPRFIPFVECFKYACPPVEHGVVVIRNIPYETTRGEIVALLGKSSKILNDREEPVHIIMDRVTSKTQDAYCELSDLDAAVELVERFAKSAENGRVGRLGNRVIEVELSSQSNLMETLFPSSKSGVIWMGANPRIVTGSASPWENFKGFISEEEMTMLGKHAENPQRSLYARICPERPYECMISTLRKMPWYMADHVTIRQRHAAFETCLKMIGTLASKVQLRENGTETKRLTAQLLERLVTSAMLCAGFSVVQKHNIATVAGMPEAKSREFNQPRFANSWGHQWTLVPKANMPIDILEWYIAVIRAETIRVVQSLDISQRMALQSVAEGVDGYWGYFWAEANFPSGRAWDDMSLGECSRLEWRALDRIITRAIRGGDVPSSYTFQSYHLTANGSGHLGYR